MMATSTGKTIGLVLLSFIIILVALQLTPLFFIPLGYISGIRGVVRHPFAEMFGVGSRNFIHFFSFEVLFSLVLLFLWIGVIVWVYRDAESRKMNGFLWALLVFIGNIVGLLIYLIVRSDSGAESSQIEQSRVCPVCQNKIEDDFLFCPNCGKRLHANCPKCNKPVEVEWKVCAHCGAELK